MDGLPDPRPDGKCVNCSTKPAVTTDKRLCKACLKRLITSLTPMVGCYRGSRRTQDHREHQGNDPSPMAENAVKSLEDHDIPIEG